MKPINIPLILTLILMYGCSKTEKVDTSQKKEQIKENLKNWVENSERGDVDNYFSFTTNDFIFLGGPGMKPVSNKDSLRSLLDTFFSNNTFSVPNWTTHEIEIRDDLAIHRYSGIVNIKSKTDTTSVDLDRIYLDVLKKNQKGEWKVYLHSFNTNR